MAEKVRAEKPRSRAKETISRQPIAQFSMGIASLEEGQHVDRMMGILSKQNLPAKTDLLVVISDNGSRGAWSIIEPESVVTTKRLALESELGKRGLGNNFLTLLQEEEEARSLSLFTQHDDTLVAHQIDHVLANRNALFADISSTLPAELSGQLAEYIRLEDTQRDLLTKALQNPKAHIEKADAVQPPRILNQPPTTTQQETIAAYARVLLGAYDDPEKDFRIALVQGSETGSFGSVKRFGLEAAKRDFAIHHPEKSVQEHVVMIGDMDTDINEQFVGNVVNAFAKNPDKNALLMQPYIVNEKRDKHGKIQLRRNLLPPPIPARFMDFTNMRSFIREHKRYPGQFLPKQEGKSELFGYHLHPGPALLFRGDVWDNPQQLLLQTDGQGEDIAATFRYQRLYGTSQTITDNSFGYGFNMRGHEAKDYVREFLAHPITFIQGIAGGRVRELIVPYQHRMLEQAMGEKPFHDFLQGINGYMKRKSLVGLLIREAEEQIFPQLTNTDLVVHRSLRMRGKALTPNIEKGERIIPGFNPISGQTEYALVRSAPPALHIHPDEFVVGQISEGEEQAILKKRSFGERTEGVSYISHSGREIPVIYHIQKRLQEKPITENDMIFAETLSTHNGRARRLASVTPTPAV